MGTTEELPEDFAEAPQGELSDLDIRLPEEWVNKVMAEYDAARRAARSPQGRTVRESPGQSEQSEPLPEGFIETAAGILIHSLLKADKEKGIAAAVEDYLRAAEDITPQRARELYKEHYA